MGDGFRIEAFLEGWLEGRPGPGYFLEIGCWDGEHLSQTAFLERVKGWTGTCVDPFPRNFEGRTCQVVPRAISLDGEPRDFVRVSVDRRHGGDVSYFSGFLNSIRHYWPLVQEHCDFELVRVETMTFGQLGERYKLPEHIDFLSVDTEGSELEVLAGIDFERYSFGLIMFEHNGDEQARRMLGQLLRARGYKLVRELEIDDIYEGEAPFGLRPLPPNSSTNLGEAVRGGDAYKAWVGEEYGRWVEALTISTVRNFKEQAGVRRMLGSFQWTGEDVLEGLSMETARLLMRIDGIGYAAPAGLSGSGARMVHYAREVLKRGPKSVVEIGGGVGEFYALLRALGYEGEYFICDLGEVQAFQDKYLREVARQTGLKLEQRLNFDFCVSFFALGEFDDVTKAWYVENVVKKCAHGYVIWNPHSGASEEVGWECRVEEEGMWAGVKRLEW